MTLYVANVDDPPRGQDWQYVVPGQYLEDLVSVTARLQTAVGPTNTVCADSSGNAQDGTYQGAVVQGEPGLIDGDAAVFFGPEAPPTDAYASLPATHVDPTGDMACVWWQEFGVNGSWTYSPFDYGFLIGVAVGGSFDLNRGGVNETNVPYVHPGPFTGRQMVGMEWDAANWFVYVNGALVATGPWVPAVFAPPVAAAPIIGSGDATAVGFVANTITDEAAFFNAKIGPANMAALYALGAAGFAAYSTGVLALGPQSYYHLDDALAPTIGRTPALVITDGQREVGAYVPSVVPAPVAAAFDYSWIVGASNNAQTPDGTQTTVGVPRLILPAGYTVGTRTPDLDSFDQWSQVTIWWNDDAMTQAAFEDPYEYPPGARLVYQQKAP